MKKLIVIGILTLSFMLFGCGDTSGSTTPTPTPNDGAYHGRIIIEFEEAP